MHMYFKVLYSETIFLVMGNLSDQARVYLLMG